MANKEFLNKGVLLDETWQTIHAPASTKHAAGTLYITPVNLLAGNVYVDVRIKYNTGDYKYLARNYAVVVGASLIIPVKLRYASANGQVLEAKLKSAPSSTTVTAITQANPGVVTLTAMQGDAHNGALIDIASIGGMVEITDGRYMMNNIAGNTFELQDQDGVNINTTAFTAYTSGGTVEVAKADAVFDYYEETIPS